MKCMTRKEFLEMVINGEINDDVKAYATERLEKLNNRKASPSEIKRMNAKKEAYDKVVNALKDGPKELKALASELEMSSQKVVALTKMGGIVREKTIVDGKVKTLVKMEEA